MPDALKVLMLSQRFPPEDRTGAPLQAWHLCLALAAQGVGVEVMTTRPVADGQRDYDMDGIHVNVLPYLHWKGFAGFSRFLVAAKRMIRERHWDIIHGHALSPMVLGAAMVRSAEHPPILVKPSIGGNHPEGEMCRIRNSFAYPLLRRALWKIDRFAVLDDLIEADLQASSIPAQRLCRVYNGVDTQNFFPATGDDKEQLRHEYDVSRHRVLLFCGQLSERKGVRELISTWLSFEPPGGKSLLVLCGDGPLRPMVQQAAEDHPQAVRYLGNLESVAGVMRAADVLLLPSRVESFGNVIMEALSSGLPVAATPCGIVPEVFKSGDCGWLIRETSVPAISETLRRVFAEEATWQRRALTGRRIAEQFSIEQVARQYISIYDQLLAGR